MPHTADFPYLIYSTSDGDVGERRALRAVDYDGVPLERNELIPLPDGATLAMMPERLAVGLDEQGDRQVVSARRGWALAALLPIGYTRVRLPGYELPPGADDDVWTLTRAERRALGIEPLPASLHEAIAVMEHSELVAETLGEHVFDFFLRNKRAEWDEYQRQVTPFELTRYLPVL